MLLSIPGVMVSPGTLAAVEVYVWLTCFQFSRRTSVSSLVYSTDIRLHSVPSSWRVRLF